MTDRAKHPASRDSMNDMLEAYHRHEAAFYKAARRTMRLENACSFIVFVIRRAMFAYIICPGSVLFCAFLAYAIHTDAYHAINQVFVWNEIDVTLPLARALVLTWVAIATGVFLGGWLLSPWESPAERLTKIEMQRWKWKQAKAAKKSTPCTSQFHTSDQASLS